MRLARTIYGDDSNTVLLMQVVALRAELAMLVTLVSNQDLTVNRPGEDVAACLEPARTILKATEPQ